jgi:FtsP/CotA-like multicopper oxidase with cupredoxin domain
MSMCNKVGSWAVRGLLAATACGTSVGDDPDLGPAVLPDLDPAPGRVEVELRAAPARWEFLPGKPAEVWAYHDGASDAAASIPGPVLELELGDEVVVHFRNDLPEDTTIHWHGMRVPNASDGTLASQAAVAPGESYDYRFSATDAGLFWYHPHIAGDLQVERGLYGAVVVRGGVEPEVANDRIFVLDDVKVEADGRLSTRTAALDVMLGRQGNVLLVNGRKRPSLSVAPGSRERWRFVNAANGRYFNLSLPGHPLLVIGTDGGLLVEPYVTDTLLVAPGERYDVLVELEAEPGERLPLQTRHYDRGHDLPDPGPLDLLELAFGDTAAVPPTPLPEAWGAVEPLSVPVGAVVHPFVLSEDETNAEEPRFYINDAAFPDVPMLEVERDAVEVWEIQNDSEMDHPFHLHGMFFQVLDEAGVPVGPLAWKDTVNVPKEQTLRFAVRYDAVGRWMYHCHILEHAERGMMGELEVMAP